jgi:hypothetical protein
VIAILRLLSSMQLQAFHPQGAVHCLLRNNQRENKPISTLLPSVDVALIIY